VGLRLRRKLYLIDLGDVSDDIIRIECQLVILGCDTTYNNHTTTHSVSDCTALCAEDQGGFPPIK
jgi:hypothetical protein